MYLKLGHIKMCDVFVFLKIQINKKQIYKSKDSLSSKLKCDF